MSLEELREQLAEIQRRMRCWETEVWMRSAEFPTENIFDCIFCKGSGEAHLCYSIECESKDKGPCCHPNAEEIRKLDALKAEFTRVTTEFQRPAPFHEEINRALVQDDVPAVIKKLLTSLLEQAS